MDNITEAHLIKETITRLCAARGYDSEHRVTKELIKNNVTSLENLKKHLNKYLEENLHELELHETVLTSFGIVIMKVESGYIYDCWDTKTDNFKLGVFVPFKTT